MTTDRLTEIQALINSKHRQEKMDVLHAAEAGWAKAFYSGERIGCGLESLSNSSKNNYEVNLFRNSIYESPDRAQFRHSPVRSYPSTFISWAPGALRICVLGNCQGPNIAKALTSLSTRPLSTCGLELMNFSENQESFFYAIDTADIILACKTYSDEFSTISIEELEKRCPGKVIAYSPIYFSGLHPDICYLGARGQRVYSPIGDYNSKIVLSAFLKKVSIVDTSRLFCDDVYEKNGFYEAFSLSHEEFYKREESLGGNSITFSKIFFDNIKRCPLLYSVNHPTSELLLLMAEHILNYLGLPVSRIASSLFSNTLSENVIWPIYTEIAQKLQLDYQNDKIFQLNQCVLSIEEFIYRSFSVYSHTDPEILAASAAAANVDCHLSF